MNYRQVYDTVFCRSWYPNGQLKKEWSPYKDIRHGRCKEWDSTGTLLYDREYERGRFIKAHDSSYYAIDTAAARIKKLLYDDAVDLLETGLMDSVYNSSLHASRPWKNEILIPEQIIDSIVDVLYAVYRNTHGMDPGRNNDRMLTNQAQNGFLNPGNHKEVVYHLFCHGVDTVQWKTNCALGLLITGNNVFDSLIRNAGGRVVAGWAGYYTGYGGYADVVFPAAINVRALLVISRQEKLKITFGRWQDFGDWTHPTVYYYRPAGEYLQSAQRREYVYSEIYVPLADPEQLNIYRVYEDGAVEYLGITTVQIIRKEPPYYSRRVPFPQKKKWFRVKRRRR